MVVHLCICMCACNFCLSGFPGLSAQKFSNITNLDCVCNISSAKSGLFNEARNAAKFLGLILIPLVSGGKFPPCLIY